MNIEQILKNRLRLVKVIPDLDKIGAKVVEGFETDDHSRDGWLKKINSSMELALQVIENKSTPWQNASNIKLPILSMASLQFSSRIYPALISGTDLVRMRTVGEDDGTKAARAKRISQHMSYQILEEDQAWEEEMDRLFITLPIVGCAFKKSYYDSGTGHVISSHVMAKDLVVNYYTKSLDTAQRITHIIEMSRNELEERFRSGIFREVDLGEPQTYSYDEKDRDEKTAVYDDTTPFQLLEQCCFFDFDKDGYKEPYVVTVLRDTGEVLRILPRFREKDVEISSNKVAKITGTNFYTKYTFIPSPDGGFYDVGFGQLLGHLNKSADTLVNQLVDAGSLANRGGGFIGRGARLKSGEMSFKIGEYKQVNATGASLKDNIVTLPFKEPSNVLFSLLSFIVDYTEKLSSVSDMMVGRTPGQNTPATTSMSALEEGLKVFSAIYKRVYRGMQDEFRKRYLLNQEYLDLESYFTVLDSGVDQKILQEDYFGDPTDVRPSADPAIMSDVQRMMRADVLSTRSMQVPGYDRGKVELRYLQALNIEGIGEIFNPEFQPAPDPKIELETAKLQLKKQELEFTQEREMMKLEIMAEKVEAEIIRLESEAVRFEADSVNLLADAEAKEAGIQLNEYRHQLETMKLRREVLNDIKDERGDERGAEGRMEGMERREGDEAISDVPKRLPGGADQGMV